MRTCHHNRVSVVDNKLNSQRVSAASNENDWEWKRGVGTNQVRRHLVEALSVQHAPALVVVLSEAVASCVERKHMLAKYTGKADKSPAI